MLLLWFYVVFEIYHVDDCKQCDMYATYEATRVPPHALTALTCHSWGILSKNCSHVTFYVSELNLIFLFFDFLKLWLINISIKLKTDLNNKPCIRLYHIQKSKATIHLPYNTWLLITNHSCGQYAVDLKLNLKSHEASVGLSDMFIFCKTVWLITEMWQQT